jgi:hypothetical protein
MSEIFSVKVESFCDRHYIKDFKKKYKTKRWNLTLQGIEDICRNPLQVIAQTDVLETIIDLGDQMICKGKFKVFGTKQSAKSSGNRFIVVINKQLQLSRVLLIYGKYHVKASNETDWWKKIVRNNYSDINKLF